MAKKVLLIDDDRDDTELFEEALKEITSSLDFFSFNDARTAIGNLQSAHVSVPDLIFLDINLPVMSGWDFLKQAKETDALAHIPVIMFTTSSQEREKDIAKDLGAIDFITKPGDFKILVKMLKDAFGKYL